MTITQYQCGGHAELCLRTGQDHQQQVLLIPPLFDEMNRMRRSLVQVMQRLDAAGVGCILPDLPGCNESLVPPETLSLARWSEALSEVGRQIAPPSLVASFRGGCLIAYDFTDAKSWQLSPVSGSALLRTLMRTEIAAAKTMGQSLSMAILEQHARDGLVCLAGNPIGADLFFQLQNAEPTQPANCRIARLSGDSKPADCVLTGDPLWLRAEPGEDSVLVEAICADILEHLSA